MPRVTTGSKAPGTVRRGSAKGGPTGGGRRRASSQAGADETVRPDAAVQVHPPGDEASHPVKRKVSLTLDAAVVEELGAFSDAPLSTKVNELLRVALAQGRLGELVEQLRDQYGPASQAARRRVVAQWLDEE